MFSTVNLLLPPYTADRRAEVICVFEFACLIESILALMRTRERGTTGQVLRDSELQVPITSSP